MLRSTQRRPTPAQLTAKPMDTTQIEATFREWWLDSYNRPPNPQAVMTHVAFAAHVLELIELLEVIDA